MGLYQRYLLPRLVQCACGSPIIDRQRQKVVPQAQGEVLEIGFGSGLNLPHYRRERVRRLWALEPSAEMRALAAPRVAASGLELHWLDLPGCARAGVCCSANTAPRPMPKCAAGRTGWTGCGAASPAAAT
ncbi:MAG: class I SAM-dependent methyltransferase [Burkholderiaceae bacterium]|nr:class I SAM-dependent methyltransferase [Burkholderiaceae bacterium]